MQFKWNFYKILNHENEYFAVFISGVCQSFIHDAIVAIYAVSFLLNKYAFSSPRACSVSKGLADCGKKIHIASKIQILMNSIEHHSSQSVQTGPDPVIIKLEEENATAKKIIKSWNPSWPYLCWWQFKCRKQREYFTRSKRSNAKRWFFLQKVHIHDECKLILFYFSIYVRFRILELQMVCVKL